MIEEAKLIEIVGSPNVNYEDAVLNEYSKDISFVKSVRPECVVKPKNAGDIEKIVKLANETLTPLVPVSSGPPHFRGDTVPGIGGAVMIDLSGMKKIIRVDRKSKVAMCEPGVTFNELIATVEKEGLRLNTPLLPRQSKSVVGSLLEREPVIMPKYHWDMADPLNCIEVIFGTGDMFRTGAAAGPGTIEEQWRAGSVQREAAGPSQASLHRIIQGAQGTMGVVTWASMSCEILPKIEEPFWVTSLQLDKILELVHWLIKLRLVNECFVLNRSNLGAILAKKWPDDYMKIKGTLPPWILFFNIAGYEYLPEERVDYQINDMMDVAQRVGLEPVRTIAGISASELLETIHYPSTEPYWKLRHKGACHDTFFLTTYDKLPKLIGVMHDIIDEGGYSASDMGIYLQPIVQGATCHCEFSLFYNQEDPIESARVRGLTIMAIKKMMAEGAFFSRPYGEVASMIMNRDAATMAALTKIKTIFDPNHIMNPRKLCF